MHSETGLTRRKRNCSWAQQETRKWDSIGKARNEDQCKLYDNLSSHFFGSERFPRGCGYDHINDWSEELTVASSSVVVCSVLCPEAR